MLPPGLSMLWESVDSEAALRERFGFEGFDAATVWVAAQLGTAWGITVTGCTRLVISGPNAIVWVTGDQGDLVLKWSAACERFASLAASTELLRTVAAQGVPVAAPIAGMQGLDRVVLDGPIGPLSVAVAPELPGEWLDVTDPAAVHAAGACLARVHRALATGGQGRPSASSRAPDLTDRIDDWLTHHDHGSAPHASRRLDELLAAHPPGLDDHLQLVHNDFRAANVLIRGSEIVGVLDFDEVVVGHRVSDLAKASVYLGTRFTDWRPTPPATRQTFRAGYEYVRPLTPAEARWYEILVLWQGLLAIPGKNDRAGWAAAV